MEDVKDKSRREDGESAGPGFTIYRASEAKANVYEGEPMAKYEDHVIHPVINDGASRFAQTAGKGADVLVLFETPTMHVTYVWFKSGFPLPLHSHDADCIYQVIAGSMRVGKDTLGKGDGVFIPSGVPYTVTPGDDGVEFLEIRPTGDYDTRFRGNTKGHWDGLIAVLDECTEAWASEKQPFGLVPLG